MASEEWKEIKRVTSARHEELVENMEDRVLLPMSYSSSALQEKRR
jgi:hypothetical protein